MRVVWFAPEMGNTTSGLVNHNRIFIDYLKNHPDVEEVIAVKFPFPEHRIMPPFKEEIRGVWYYRPRISIDYRDAFKSILQEDLKFVERLKIRLFKLMLKLKRIKQLDLDKIKKWGKMETGLIGMTLAQMPFPNPLQKQIGRFIAEFQPDIIQSHIDMISIAGSVAKDTAKGHISYQILVEEEKESLPPRSLIKAMWERSEDALQWLEAHQAVDAYIAASKFVKTLLQKHGIDQRKIKVINSPIVLKHLTPLAKAEARSKLGIPQDKRVILSVGRLIERKRFIDIIRILDDFPEDVILYIKRCVTVSDDMFPSALKMIEKEIRKRKLENRVIINPEILPYKQMSQVYSAADVVVFPFLHEPFGMVAAEAMAVGRPLVVYNSGYLPNFINGNGFIVEPMDLDALREKILNLLDDPALADEMGAKGPDLVKQYDVQVLGEKLLDIYREYL